MSIYFLTDHKRFSFFFSFFYSVFIFTLSLMYFDFFENDLYIIRNVLRNTLKISPSLRSFSTVLCVCLCCFSKRFHDQLKPLTGLSPATHRPPHPFVLALCRLLNCWLCFLFLCLCFRFPCVFPYAFVFVFGCLLSHASIFSGIIHDCFAS